ncbi:MAG: hypothetical protein BWK80_33460 [Desulfobacteraceae bacterium IS3]|nr:MAG: hypothetical protein BWK80_33460 [Desulfobacteraceae bacterium IS3]
MAQVRKNLPNGYALFSVTDVETETARLKKAEVRSVGKPQKLGPDTYCVISDADENMLVLWEKDFKTAADAVPKVSGFPSDTPLSLSSQKFIYSWLSSLLLLSIRCTRPEAHGLITRASGIAVWNAVPK